MCAIAKISEGAHGIWMVKDSPLDDPQNAAHAWTRFRYIMRVLAMVTVGSTAALVAVLWVLFPDASIHFFVAVALGAAFTMGLTGALMGLVFLSNGTGHDEAVDNRLPSADELFGDREGRS
ncbi:MAG: hypothetical protein AAGB23_03670 [Pseudomonadota bacterium]